MNLLVAALLTRNLTPQVPAVTPDDYGAVIAGISGLVSWWRMGDESGPGTAFDEEGVQDGSYQGGTTLGQSPLPADTTNSAVALNGSTGHVQVTHNASYSLSTGTLAVWLRVNSLATDLGIFNKNATGLTNPGDFFAWWDASHGLRVAFQFGGVQYDILAASALHANTIHCLIFRWGASTPFDVWVKTGDSLVQVAAHASQAGTLVDNVQPWMFGRTTNIGADLYLPGVLDDTILWNRRLSTSEMEMVSQAQAGAPPAPAELALCYSDSGTVINVSSASALTSALSNATAGHRITLAAGTYAGTFTLSNSGTDGNPIVIRAASGASVIFTGTFNLNGNYGVLENLAFNPGVVWLRGDFNRVTKCLFQNFVATALTVVSGSASNRIDRNEFANMANVGSPGHTAIYVNPVPGSTTTTSTRIDHNYFHDFPSTGSTNGHEAIWLGVALNQVGTSTACLVDHNLFHAINSDAEIVKITCDDNRLIGNTYTSCRGSVSNRQGARTLYKNEWIENCDGLNVFSDDVDVIGCRLVGNPSTSSTNPIRLAAADTNYDIEVSQLPSPNPFRPCARRALVAGCVKSSSSDNTIVHVGYPFATSFPAENCVVEQVTGTVTLGTQTGTVQNPTTTVDLGTQVKLTTSQVGRGIADESCPV